MLGELVGGLAILNIFMGVRLGFWEAFKRCNWKLSSIELAKEVGCSERYCREWLECISAHGYLTPGPGAGEDGPAGSEAKFQML